MQQRHRAEEHIFTTETLGLVTSIAVNLTAVEFIIRKQPFNLPAELMAVASHVTTIYAPAIFIYYKAADIRRDAITLRRIYRFLKKSI